MIVAKKVNGEEGGGGGDREGDETISNGEEFNSSFTIYVKSTPLPRSYPWT